MMQSMRAVVAIGEERGADEKLRATGNCRMVTDTYLLSRAVLSHQTHVNRCTDLTGLD